MRIGYGENVPGRRLAERASFVAAVLGVAMGLLFLFAPIQGYCMTTATGPQPGVPATPERDQKLQIAAVSKLPEMRREFKALRRAIAELQKAVLGDQPPLETDQAA